MRKIIAAVFALSLLTSVTARPCTGNPDLPVDEGVHINAEQMPKFMNGDVLTFQKWLADNIDYPGKLFKNGVHGTVVVSFVVNVKGKVEQVEALSSPDEGLTRVVVKAVKRSPRWEPGRQAGVPVAVRQTVPVRFGMPSDSGKEDNNGKHEGEVMPTFMGGNVRHFGKWVASQVQYPNEATNKRIEGTVILSFAVDTDGSIVDVVVEQSPHYLLSEEAMRAVRSSPKWTPGKLGGEAVKIKFKIPVNFKR